MTVLPTLHTAVHDLAGGLVLNLTPAAGYRRLGITGNGGVTWRENLTDGPYAEGSAEVTPAVRASLKRVERIKVKGDPALTGDPYWDSVEERILALETAVSQRFLWVIGAGSYLWTYRTVGPANVDATDLDKDHLAAGYRVVLLAFTVQPNPTRAIPGGP